MEARTCHTFVLDSTTGEVEVGAEVSGSDAFLQFLGVLVQIIHEHLKYAKQDLLVASREHPVHGPMMALRFLLEVRRVTARGTHVVSRLCLLILDSNLKSALQQYKALSILSYLYHIRC